MVAREGLWSILAGISLWLASSAAVGAPGESRVPPHVRVVLVGDAQTVPALFERIRSLFDTHTQVVVQTARSLDSSAILRPDVPDTLYLWITVQARSRTRIYASARQMHAPLPRHLFREEALETGLDEVGGETIAQIAHSSAIALWARETQTSAPELAAELELERQRERESAPTVPAATAPAATASAATASAATASAATASAATASAATAPAATASAGTASAATASTATASAATGSAATASAATASAATASTASPPTTPRTAGAAPPTSPVSNGSGTMRILIPTFPASQSTEVPVTAEGPAAAQAAALPIAFAIGAHYGVHESGDEGWLHRVGAFGSILHKNRLSFRILAAYLVPIGFNARAADVPSARVDLSGAYAEARAGWRTGPLGTVRGVVEAGVGMLYAEWKTSGPADAGSRTGGGVRMYGVASAGIAWSVGPLSVGAQIELAVPTNDTSYEVETDGKRQKMASSWLNPGANLEITVPLSSGAGESARHVENEPRGRGPLGCIRPSSTEVH